MAATKELGDWLTDNLHKHAHMTSQIHKPGLDKWFQRWRGLGFGGPRGKGSPSVSKGPKPPIQLLQLLKNNPIEVKRAHFRYIGSPRVPPRRWNYWGQEGKVPPGPPRFLQPWHKLLERKHDPYKYHQILRNITGRTRHDIIPPLLTADGHTVTDDEDKATIFNDHFALQSQLNVPANHAPVSYNRGPVPTLDTIATSPQEIIKIINSLDPNKSCGPDQFTWWENVVQERWTSTGAVGRSRGAARAVACRLAVPPPRWPLTTGHRSDEWSGKRPESPARRQSHWRDRTASCVGETLLCYDSLGVLLSS